MKNLLLTATAALSIALGAAERPDVMAIYFPN